MKLHWSPRSPYVRKVMITLHETGRLSEVTQVRTVVSAHEPPNPEILRDNPLGKIPALVTEEGVLFDSRVICTWLDKDGALLADSVQARRWQALADGATEILLAWRTELTRPSGPWQPLTDSYRTKIRAVMATLEGEAQLLADVDFGAGHVALVCYLGQLDFRWPDCNWRCAFPRLAQVAATWEARPSVRATAVRDDGGSDTSLTAGQLTFAKETP
ncbi:glutathione S-transferase [Pseudooceanicola sediminis]|uniref:Glutathione S-transferase n=1 Tax=Pseudooceanicola sediminis TaxID=2211117 RepID=A0A399IZT8_9RHOB|nr:glutathione S-transferase family protein [Pseudooceanicola sediminis]KAA2312673.1 glutathione S-transferase [Puniceibacterium sp. HSS470]RII37112.1 glutathione S-transferase [Pseudooceanicola sediminis]